MARAEEDDPMKLYENPFSPNARRVLTVAHHLGIKLDEQLIDFTKGDNRKPEFLAINPNGRIPALTDGDFKLFESRAIIQYLASQKPDAGLWPSEAKAQADVARWLFWDAAHFAAALGSIAFERLVKPMMGAGEPSQSAIADALTQYERCAKVLDAHLKGRDWLVGKQITLADYSLAASLTYAAATDVPLDPYPNIKSWLGRIRELPAWRATEPKMG
jgi:glutathione S-transferase